MATSAERASSANSAPARFDLKNRFIPAVTPSVCVAAPEGAPMPSFPDLSQVAASTSRHKGWTRLALRVDRPFTPQNLRTRPSEDSDLCRKVQAGSGGIERSEFHFVTFLERGINEKRAPPIYEAPRAAPPPAARPEEPCSRGKRRRSPQ